jgi:hypothetical protein
MSKPQAALGKYNPHEDYEMPLAEPVIIESQRDQFTIGELVRVLQDLLIAYPELTSLPVFHVECGCVVPSRKVEIPRSGDMMVIEQ